MRYFQKLAILLIFNFLIFALPGCKSIMCSEKEIYRVTSPDGIVDAVVIERDCGATTSVSTNIFIIPKGARVENETPVFVADHLESLEVKWAKPKFLAVTYADARIFRYTNFWNSGSVDNFNYTVSIREYQKQ